MGVEARVVGDGERERPSGSEVERLCCESGKAQRRTGWRPRVSLEEGLDLTIDWMREHDRSCDDEGYAI